MATFAPTSTIRLCTVPFDNSYKNQVYFGTSEQQRIYFNKLTLHILTDYLVVRKTLPNGGFQSSIKVGKNIDELQGCNYMVYQNANHGDKWFYAFITRLVYINEETTELIFETDVYQTWLFDVELRDSFVVREHSVTDNYNEHVVPEPFGCGDYTYTYVDEVDYINEWGYLIALSNPSDTNNTGEMAKEISGVFQGLYFYYIEDWKNSQIQVFLNSLDIDSVQFITMIPKICVKGNTIGSGDGNILVSPYYVQDSAAPYNMTHTLYFDRKVNTFEGYVPKNNKMYTSPWMNLVISNHGGKTAVYNVEEFSGSVSYTDASSLLDFSVHADVSASPSVFIYPKNYKGLPNNYDCGFTLTDFPQCSYANDAYKLWMAKNHELMNVRGLESIARLGGSAGTAIATGGAAGIDGMFAACADMLELWASKKAAEHTANRATAGNPRNNLLTGMKKYTIAFYKRTARKDFAKTVDDFFTMYGYQTNKVKIPNVSSRPYFNYVKTNGVNIKGGIPGEDMERLKRMYNEGVTFWKSDATVGDYSVDNRP